MQEFLVQYQIIVTVALGWCVAQVLKTLIYAGLYKTFNPERLVGSGGMPSSHSATVCSLVLVSFYKFGLSSYEFAASAVLALIVMHDAMNVRLETGKQAKIINEMMELNPLLWKDGVTEKQLKELVGHTPLQVFVGAVLGLFIAFCIQMICVG